MRKLAASVVLGVAGLVSCITPAVAQPPDLVVAVGDEFARDGKAYRFIGMNIRGLVHYGGGDGALPYTSLAHIDENLAGAAAMGCRVVRVFAADKYVSAAEAVNRLGYALDRAQAHGIKLIIALTDFYPTPFHPQGDDGYYTMNPYGWTVLNHAWFAGGYEEHYLPYVTLAVSTYKDHPAVFCWQLGNELADQGSADTHDAFCHAVAAHIKAIDPYHMVSTGMLSLAHIPGYTVQRGVALYADENLDFITAHRYNDDRHAIDFQVRDLVGKPLLISEAGCDRNNPAVAGGDRVAFMDGRVELFVNTLGARGFMNWGYQAQGYDIGDGDGIFGIDRYSHGDYDAMVAMYAGHAAELNAYEAPVGGEASGPRGRNLALEAAAWEADTVFGAEYVAEKACDGALETKWTSTDATAAHWLALDLGEEQVITGFRVRMAGAAGEWPAFNFEAYMLQTGPGLDGPWTNVAGVRNPGQLSEITTALQPAVRGRCVRIYITDCGVDDYARLPELEVIGDPNPRADLDGDGDVDLHDVGQLQKQAGDEEDPAYEWLDGCLAGPGVDVPLGCY